MPSSDFWTGDFEATPLYYDEKVQPRSNSALELLIGKRLVAVCFVLDSVTFQFDDLVLTALADPFLVTPNVTFTRGHAAIRDALCDQIGNSVHGVVDDQHELRIQFKIATLVIPLNVETPPGPELATLSGRGHFYQSWLRADVTT